MPDAKNNAKLTGDTHLPDIEGDDLPQQEGSSEGTGAAGTPREQRGQAASPGGQESRAGRGINQAGFLKDKDDATRGSDGGTRDAGGKPR